MPNGKAVIAEFLSSPIEASEPITIFCTGPNAFYYHTEGNRPGLGQNDNGKIDPGNHSSFKITSTAVGCSPDVYIEAKYGETNCAVFVGPMNLATLDLINYLRR